MNLILILQIIFLLTILRLRNDGHKLILIALMSLFGFFAYLYQNDLGHILQFNLITLIFFGTLMLSIVLKRKDELLIISMASLSMYPVTPNHSFFLQTLLFIALFASSKKDLFVKDKLYFILGLLVWPTFVVIDSFSFSYEVKFMCAALLTFLLVSRAQKVTLSPIAFYALILSQVLFLRSFDYTPEFSRFFILLTLFAIAALFISKKTHSFVLSIIQVFSVVFCGIKTLPFFTSYYTTLALSDSDETRNSQMLGRNDILRLVFLVLIMLFGLVAFQNAVIAIALILLLTIGNSKTFFRPLGQKKMSSLEVLTYVILMTMNVFVVFYV